MLLQAEKMAHMHRNGKRIVACSAKSENQRMLIAAGGHTVPSMEHRENFGFLLFGTKNEPFGNSFSNFDFLIITKNSGGLAAMHTVMETTTTATHLGVIGGLLDDFWGHPERRADEGLSFVCGVGELTRHTKVGQFDISVL